MKKLKWISLLVISLICNTSCELIFSPVDPYHYTLQLSFQDASGKDLVKGIGYDNSYPDSLSEDEHCGSVNRDLYIANFAYPSDPETLNGLGIDVCTPKSSDDPFNGYYFLIIGIIDKRIDRSNAEIIFHLTCPYIFGDDNEHDIDSYWTIKKQWAEIPDIRCYKIIFDGNKIITDIKSGGYSGPYLATIITERK